MRAIGRMWFLALPMTVMLGGCAGDGNGGESAQSAPTVTATVTETPTSSPSPTDETNDDNNDNDDDGASGVGLPPRPDRDECVEVRPRGDGRYRVYDAGTAVVRRSGASLQVGEVKAAQGWTARVTEQGGDDDVEVEFRPRKRGSKLELEVEIDDGRLEVQICADDRDDRDDRDD